MKDWLTNILEGLVTHPDDIAIEEKTDERGILFTVSVNKEDMGVLIGRKGEHITALRMLLRIRGHIEDVKAGLKISE